MKVKKLSTEEREELRKLHKLKVTVKIYSFLSMFFAIVGLFFFLNLYLENIEGRFMQVIRYPSTFVLFLFPFLPGLIFWVMSIMKQKRFRREAAEFAKKTGG